MLRMLCSLGIIVSAFCIPLSASAEDFSGRTFTIGIHNRAPWGYREPSGAVIGYHPDLVRAALAPLGVTKIEFVVADFGALIPGLIANRFDMVASGVTITPPRCEQVTFGEPDLAVGDGLLVAKGNPLNLHSYADIIRNPEIKLGTGRGAEHAKNAMNAGIPESQILLFPNNEAVLSAMQAGRVQAGTLSGPSVAALIETGALKDIERALPFQGYIQPNGRPRLQVTGIVFRKDETALRDAYNRELAKLKADGTVKKLMDKYKFTEEEKAPDVAAADICAGKF